MKSTDLYSTHIPNKLMFVKVSEFKPKNLAFITKAKAKDTSFTVKAKAKAKDFHDVLKDTPRPMPRTNIPRLTTNIWHLPPLNVLRGILLGAT